MGLCGDTIAKSTAELVKVWNLMCLICWRYLKDASRDFVSSGKFAVAGVELSSRRGVIPEDVELLTVQPH